MALYIEKAKYAGELINKLSTQYPGIESDPLLYNLIHTTCRAMPRVQTAVEEGYVREVVRLAGNKVKIAKVTKKNWKQEDYQTIEVQPLD